MAMEVEENQINHEFVSQQNLKVSNNSLQLTSFPLKQKIFQVIEELRLRRLKDRENADKIDHLLAQTLILKREKEEEKEKFSKEILKVRQEMREEQRKSQEQLLQLQEDKMRNALAIEANAESFKALKDELMALQLNKHNLEKRLVDQGREFELQLSHRGCHLGKMTSVQEDVSLVNEKVNSIVAEVEELQTKVSTVSSFVTKLKNTNQHLQSIVSTMKMDENRQQQEIVGLRSKFGELQARIGDGNLYRFQEHSSKNEAIGDETQEKSTINFIEIELKRLQDENKRLTERLIETTDLVEKMTRKITKSAGMLETCEETATQTSNGDFQNSISTDTFDLDQ